MRVLMELLGINSYDLAVLDRDIPGPSGDEIARRIVASGRGIRILMLTAADPAPRHIAGIGGPARATVVLRCHHQRQKRVVELPFDLVL